MASKHNAAKSTTKVSDEVWETTESKEEVVNLDEDDVSCKLQKVYFEPTQKIYIVHKIQLWKLDQKWDGLRVYIFGSW